MHTRVGEFPLQPKPTSRTGYACPYVEVLSLSVERAFVVKDVRGRIHSAIRQTTLRGESAFEFFGQFVSAFEVKIVFGESVNRGQTA